MQLILDTKGLTLAKKNGIFHVFNEKSERVISPGKLTSIAITANVRIDASAVLLAVKHEIPILFFDRIGKVQAKLWHPYFSTIASLRRGQVHFAQLPEATAWILDLFELKTLGQIENLQWIRQHHANVGWQLTQTINTLKANNRFEDFRGQILSHCQKNIMGVEGALASVYWTTLGKSMPRNFRFNKRSRRPAEDVFNAVLNYLYGMLYSVVEGALHATGLDPQLGLLHADAHTKPTLAFDLIEPFRPWIDQLLIQACFEQKLLPSHCSKNQYGIFLNKEGKAFIIPLFNDFLRANRTFLGQESSNKNHIHFLSGKLAQRIRSVTHS